MRPILVVERDDLLREWVCALLGRSGYAVLAADSAKGALSAAQPGLALILVDLFLPQTNGLMLLEALRGLPGLAAVPAIVLSSMGFPEIVQQAVAAGAQDFVLKPFDPQVLLDKVNGVVSGDASVA